MNYNPYANYYPYNGIPNFPSATTTIPQQPITQAPTTNYMQQPQQTPQLTQPMTMLNGKFVDSADIVKATEVPLGGYGIFPKADLSEIFIKTWNNNGTTNVVTYQPVIPPAPQEVLAQQDDVAIEKILAKIDSLENKFDSILNNTINKPIENKSVETKSEKKTGGIINGF